MIRSLIEVSAETDWEHKKQLEAALDQLGYEPKRSEDHGKFMNDLYHCLEAQGIHAPTLVNEYRSKRDAEAI